MTDSNPLVEVKHKNFDETARVPLRGLARYESRGWSRVEAPADELKGKELDAALDAAGLPKSGSADEKRARLAEHQAGQGNDNTEES